MGVKAERFGWSRCLPALLIAAALNTGCDDGSQHVTFAVAASAEWINDPASAADVGYQIVVAALALPPDEDKPCKTPSSSTRLFINGQETAIDLQVEDGCMGGGQVLRPLLHDQAVTVTLEEAGEVTATASFKNLLPGTAATLSGPTELHEGDDLVIRPVPDVPAGWTSMASFYLLDDPVWQSMGVLGNSKRQSDGLHVRVPAFSGRAVLAVRYADYDLSAAEVSCPGFGFCFGECAGALGPFFVTGVP